MRCNQGGLNGELGEMEPEAMTVARARTIGAPIQRKRERDLHTRIQYAQLDGRVKADTSSRARTVPYTVYVSCILFITIAPGLTSLVDCGIAQECTYTHSTPPSIHGNLLVM